MFSDNISNDLHYLLKTYFLVNFVDLIKICLHSLRQMCVRLDNNISSSSFRKFLGF
jgi:hypothetical protein